MPMYRHPAEGSLSVSLSAFLEGLPLSEQGRVTSALADGIAVARYGSGTSGGTVFTYGDRRGDLPGLPPSRIAGLPLAAIVEPARDDTSAVAKSPLKAHMDSPDPHLAVLGSKPRWVRPPEQQPRTEMPMVTTGSMRTSPDPRSGRAPMELLQDREPPPARQGDPVLDWYRQKLAR